MLVPVRERQRCDMIPRGIIVANIVMSTSVCLPVCLSVRENISRTTRAIFTKFCMLTVAVARSSSGGVTKSRGKRAILGFFFHIDNALYGPYSGMNFAMKDQFWLKLLAYRKVWQNSISEY